MFKKKSSSPPKGDKAETKIIVNAFQRRGWYVKMIGYPPDHTIIANKPGRTVRGFFDSRSSQWIFVEGTRVTRKFKKFINREDKN